MRVRSTAPYSFYPAGVVVGFLASVVLGAGCGRRPSLPEAPHPIPRFTPAAAAAGIDFRHEDGGSGRFYFPELMGPGCAFADFTGDGLPDLYLLNGAPLPGAPGGSYRSRFYRNNGDGTFTDATAASGLAEPGYGIGCCAGDYDNDGRLDLFVTTLGRCVLYRGVGSGVFREVTGMAGVGASGFSAGAAFADYDGDGDLDLYVCRYIRWSPETNVACRVQGPGGRVRAHCRPDVYPPAPDILYRNNGDGTFTDVTAAAGMDVPPAWGLGVVWSDVDLDGDADLFVANDMAANFLFINRGDGTFREEAARRGVALDVSGRPQAGMGAAAADFDGDGHMDLACTNFAGEYLALYRNSGGGQFEDVSAESGLAQVTAPYVGFGLDFSDLDLDGRPDLLVANGHVSAAGGPAMRAALAQPALCLLNDGRGGFVPLPRPGPALAAPRVGRGLAAADYDRDGDVDYLLARWTDAPDLLRNDLPPGGTWLRLRLEGRRNRSAVGARVEVEAGGRTQVRELRSGGSYCSQGELALTYGLAGAASARVRVLWPGGGESAWEGLAAGREHILTQR